MINQMGYSDDHCDALDPIVLPSQAYDVTKIFLRMGHKISKVSYICLTKNINTPSIHKSQKLQSSPNSYMTNSTHTRSFPRFPP